jgi:hypothetical protein
MARGNDWMALLVALVLVLYAPPPIANASGMAPVGQGGLWQLLDIALYVVGTTLFYLVFALFPSGRLVPGWMVVPLVGWVVLHLQGVVYVAPALPDWLTGLIYLALYVCIIGAQVYRYRRRSSMAQRQQTKWVVCGIVLVLLANIAYWQPYAFLPTLRQPDSLYPVFGFLAYQLVTLAVPLSFGVAILRYRLYDVDLFINRALVYSALSAVLALVYFAGVTGGQVVAGRLAHTGDQGQSPAVVVITTLVIAALFQPLRRRIQTAIDRRFYRSKYDAARTVAAFGRTLRSEVDLGQLSDHLVVAVRETMRPSHVSLWLIGPHRPATIPPIPEGGMGDTPRRNGSSDWGGMPRTNP